MKKQLLVVLFCSFSFYNPFAQELNNWCGEFEATEKIRISNPELWKEIERTDEELLRHTKKFIENKSRSDDQVYIIPVVFHIIHNFGIENISDEQVRDGIRVLNEDFRKLNADTTAIIAAFKDIAADSKIEFRLAQTDPWGKGTRGIVRVESDETYVGANYFGNNSTSSLSRWPRDKYLNIWVVNSIGTGGVAGYTYRPGAVNTSPEIDGIVILHNYVGSIGTSTPQRSRTLSHEVGHWINLPHPWGNSNTPGLASNCDIDDGVDDTPNTIGWRSCVLSGTSCGSLDNVQNHMDYSYCSNMFTQGQVDRMRAAVTSTVSRRSSLWQTSNLISTGTNGVSILHEADFTANLYETCEGKTVQFRDNSFHDPLTWSWNFTGGSPSTSTSQNPEVTYNNSGKYRVALTASNASGSKNTAFENAITVLPKNGRKLPAFESFSQVKSFPAENWFINNPDNGITWTPSEIGFDDDHSLTINNFLNTRGRIDDLISSTYDLSGMPEVNISFKVAYAQRTSSTNDGLSFFISNDCGETWLYRWKRAGTHLASVPPQTEDFAPSDKNQWREFIITTIPVSHRVENFRFKFEFESQEGNNIYIDDIVIFDPATVSVDNIQHSNIGFSIYPNPTNENTNIAFELSKSSNVELTLLDILGKKTILISNQKAEAGQHQLNISKNGLNLSPGVYFVRLIVDGNPTIKKLIIK
jgi:PKD repeat protein